MASNLNIMAASSDSTEVMSVTKGGETSTDTTTNKGYSLGGSGGLQGMAFQAANLSLVGYFMMIFTILMLTAVTFVWTWRQDNQEAFKLIQQEFRDSAEKSRDLFRSELREERQLFREETANMNRTIQKLDTTVGVLATEIRKIAIK